MRRDLQSLQGTVEAMERELPVDAGLELHDRPERASTMKGFQPFGVSWYEWLFVTVLVLFLMWFGANVL